MVAPTDSQASLTVATGTDLSACDLHDILRLRVDIFVVEQACPYPELDGLDMLESTRHVWFADDAGPTSYLRILGDPNSVDIVGEIWRIGRVVTRADMRGAGLAARLMRAAIELVGGAETVLDAQSHLQDFYASLGFLKVGEEYIEDGIPHVPMRRPDIVAT